MTDDPTLGGLLGPLPKSPQPPHPHRQEHPMTETAAWVSHAPDGFTDAQWHMDAIADSGHGYEVERDPTHGWRIRCLWCSWDAHARLKRDAVSAYRDHERERQQACNDELRARGMLGPAEASLKDLAALYPEVDRFRTLMLRELEANSRKGNQAGWLRADPEALLHDITWHWAKLAMAWRDKKHALGYCRDAQGCADPLGDCTDHAPIDARLREHAADVANMSLMFLDRVGLLTVSLPVEYADHVPDCALRHVPYDDCPCGGRTYAAESED